MFSLKKNIKFLVLILRYIDEHFLMTFSVNLESVITRHVYAVSYLNLQLLQVLDKVFSSKCVTQFLLVTRGNELQSERTDCLIRGNELQSERTSLEV